MAQFSIKSVNELHEEMCERDELSKRFKDHEVTLTKEERKQMLDITIEQRCKWPLLRHYPILNSELEVVETSNSLWVPDIKTATITPADVNAIAEQCYKYIVSAFDTNSQLVLATRAVKFDVDYVKNIVKRVNAECVAKAKKATTDKSMNFIVQAINSGEIMTNDISEKSSVPYIDLEKGCPSKSGEVSTTFRAKKGESEKDEHEKKKAKAKLEEAGESGETSEETEKSGLYVDLEKALDTNKLVKKQGTETTQTEKNQEPKPVEKSAVDIEALNKAIISIDTKDNMLPEELKMITGQLSMISEQLNKKERVKNLIIERDSSGFMKKVIPIYE